jgi:hypothetical protein
MIPATARPLVAPMSIAKKPCLSIIQFIQTQNYDYFSLSSKKKLPIGFLFLPPVAQDRGLRQAAIRAEKSLGAILPEIYQLRKNFPPQANKFSSTGKIIFQY